MKVKVQRLKLKGSTKRQVSNLRAVAELGALNLNLPLGFSLYPLSFPAA
jgi:hypothetical protein